MFSSKVKQDLIYIIIALVIIFLVYLAIQLKSYYNKPSGYVLAQNGTITSYEQDTAYILREESVIDTSSYSGDRQIVVQDNTRAAKGDIITYFIEDDNTDIKVQLAEVDKNIEEAMSEIQKDYSQEVKTVDKNIANSIYNVLKYKNTIYELNTKLSDTHDLLEERVKVIGETVNKNSTLSALVKDRMQLEKELSKNRTSVKAPSAGLVSYRVDGYEDQLRPDNFSNITVEYLNKIKYSTDQQIPISKNQIKIINNFDVYLIVVTNAESSEAQKLHLNDTIKFSLNNNFSTISKGTIEYIIKDGDKRYLFIKTKDDVETLSQYRKVSVNLVWWSLEGIKVSNENIAEETIVDEEGNEVAVLNYVNIQSSTGYVKKVWVKVLNSAGGASIVENYDEQELLDMGLDSSIVKGRSKLNLYDKVLFN